MNANNLFKKKAQGLSLTVIILAVLAIIVLVVVIAMFAGRIGIFGKELASCAGKGGACYELECNKLTPPLPEIRGTDCEKLNPNKPHCCLTVIE